jgi:hypothetical protein
MRHQVVSVFAALLSRLAGASPYLSHTRATSTRLAAWALLAVIAAFMPMAATTTTARI